MPRFPLVLVLVTSLFSPTVGDRRPLGPPALPPARPALHRTIHLDVEVDAAFAAEHGHEVEGVLRESIAILNAEWARSRREWFDLGTLRVGGALEEADASWVLARFLHRTRATRDTVNVLVSGRPLEVYSNGTSATPIGGLAYRGSDVVLVSAPPGVGTELLAYYLYHELGHCWDAFDIPFHGGDTTYGSKRAATFRIDAGNQEIMEQSPGPRPRDTPRLAPAVVREKLALAREATRGTPGYAALGDLLLHEASPSNPAWVRKKAALVATPGVDRGRVEELLARYEITRRHLREEADVTRQLAEHYWRANDAIARHDYDVAEAELDAIRLLSETTPNVRMLVGAVERRVRRRR